MKRAAAVVALLALTACGGPAAVIPDVDLLIRVTAAAQTVTPGKAFPLTVVRVWEKTLAPQPWSEHALAPLVLDLESTSRREDPSRVEETRRYRAYAFTRKDLHVPAASLVAKTSDDQTRVTHSQRVRLRVQPQVFPEDPGPPELPHVLGTAGFPRWAWALLLVLVSLAFVLRIRAHARRRATQGAHEPPRNEGPSARAIRRLEALRDGPPDPSADVIAVANVLRDYLVDAYALPARERTTEQVADALPSSAWAAARRRDLATLLADADRTKYGRHVPDLPTRSQALTTALAVVVSSDPGGRA